jgi:hypothetical protein
VGCQVVALFAGKAHSYILPPTLRKGLVKFLQERALVAKAKETYR